MKSKAPNHRLQFSHSRSPGPLLNQLNWISVLSPSETHKWFADRCEKKMMVIFSHNRDVRNVLCRCIS